jgi:cholesterol transport system auxiliary component
MKSRPRGFRRRKWALVGAFLALCGCGATPRETFDLQGASVFEKTHLSKLNQRAALSVAEPTADQLLNSNRLVVRQEAGNLAYLADAQWADRAPRLVQARVISRLVRGGVDAAFPGGVVWYDLTTELRRFEIDAPRGVAVVEIAARISSDQSGALRGAAVFLGEAAVQHTQGPQAANALDEALDRATAQLVVWTRKRI